MKLAVLLVGALLVLLTGCSSLAQRQQRTADAQPEVARIQAELRQQPGVTDARISYADAGINGADMDIDLVLTPATFGQDRVQQLADLAAKLAWLSTIEPLDAVAVAATDGQPTGGSIQVLENATPQQTSALRARYGPRPSATPSAESSATGSPTS